MSTASLLILGLILIGIVAGFLSGMIGIGGGIIIVPALVILFGFSQHQAQGTTLALLAIPVGILAVVNYYQQGYVDLKTTLLICIGFIVGSYFGSKIAIQLPQDILRKIFAVVIFLVALKMFFQK